MKTWYRNLKISIKITSSFLLVAMIAGAIGIIGIVSLNSVGGSYSVAYTDSVIALASMEKVSGSFQEMRQDLLEMLLVDSKGDKDACFDAFKRHSEGVKEGLVSYNAMLTGYNAEEVVEEQSRVDAVGSTLTAFHTSAEAFSSSPAVTDPDRYMEAYRVLGDGGELNVLAQAVEEAIADLVQYNTDYANQQILANGALASAAGLTTTIGVAIGVVVAVLIGLGTARSISKPIGQIVEAANKLADGDFNINIDNNSKDETGQLAQRFQNMADALKTIIADLTWGLGAFAEGNFALDSQAKESYVGDYYPLLDSIIKMRDNITHTLLQINSAAEQVATGSDQVSSGAQALAAGSTEQAASVEELAASVETIAKQAEDNSAAITEAGNFVAQTGIDVNAGNEHMAQLSQAMADISTTSNQIANITKVIEDIAFQTNILSLNAAIEAARAGNAGKGFAVVADEVRNLAAKSAEAAKQTGELIQASVDTVARGTKITNQTVQILQDVGTSATEVVDSFEKIEKSIAEQTVAIEQIKVGLAQISTVVQTNAATAEENSAASEEMSAQAVTLREEVGKFRLLTE
ncbi:MAG: methyl-accepting chemotaxis protein [Clostridiales bacterium]|nr:methyl-accepting chemotaxis protein [Clostridiales bacterium]